MIERIRLKACPFCDSIPTEDFKIRNNFGYIAIDCPDCKLSFGSDGISSDASIDRFIAEYEALVNKWNKRY